MLWLDGVFEVLAATPACGTAARLLLIVVVVLDELVVVVTFVLLLDDVIGSLLCELPRVFEAVDIIVYSLSLFYTII